MPDDANAMGGRVLTVKKNTEVLVVASKETGLQINVDITLFMVKSRDQIAGHNHNTKSDNKPFEIVRLFKYFKSLQTTLMNQKSIQK
jgi:hypothetical protein